MGKRKCIRKTGSKIQYHMCRNSGERYPILGGGGGNESGKKKTRGKHQQTKGGKQN